VTKPLKLHGTRATHALSAQFNPTWLPVENQPAAVLATTIAGGPLASWDDAATVRSNGSCS
jgi:hypothetical protein